MEILSILCGWIIAHFYYIKNQTDQIQLLEQIVTKFNRAASNESKSKRNQGCGKRKIRKNKDKSIF